jgi:hypothetical protein
VARLAGLGYGYDSLIQYHLQMKAILKLGSIITVALLPYVGVGCHKQAVVAPHPETLQEGLDRLGTALISASPAVQSNLVTGVSFGVRYGDYARASSALQQIASDPGLNQPQKDAVSDVRNLLNQAIADNATTSK